MVEANITRRIAREFSLNEYPGHIVAKAAMEELVTNTVIINREFAAAAGKHFDIASATLFPNPDVWRLFSDGRNQARTEENFIFDTGVVPVRFQNLDLSLHSSLMAGDELKNMEFFGRNTNFLTKPRIVHSVAFQAPHLEAQETMEKINETLQAFWAATNKILRRHYQQSLKTQDKDIRLLTKRQPDDARVDCTVIEWADEKFHHDLESEAIVEETMSGDSYIDGYSPMTNWDEFRHNPDSVLGFMSQVARSVKDQAARKGLQARGYYYESSYRSIMPTAYMGTPYGDEGMTFIGVTSSEEHVLPANDLGIDLDSQEAPVRRLCETFGARASASMVYGSDIRFPLLIR